MNRVLPGGFRALTTVSDSSHFLRQWIVNNLQVMARGLFFRNADGETTWLEAQT
jgi:hypothetical protein